ncbi:MAG: flagellar hook-length control protein FliK [Terriglobia bacterium]
MAHGMPYLQAERNNSVVQSIPSTQLAEISQTPTSAAAAAPVQSFQSHLDHAVSSQSPSQGVVSTRSKTKSKGSSASDSASTTAAAVTPSAAPQQQPAIHKALGAATGTTADSQSPSSQTTGSTTPAAGNTGNATANSDNQGNGIFRAIGQPLVVMNPMLSGSGALTTSSSSSTGQDPTSTAPAAASGPVNSASDGQDLTKSSPDAQAANGADVSSSNSPFISKQQADFTQAIQQAADKISANTVEVAANSKLATDGKAAPDSNPAPAAQTTAAKSAPAAPDILNRFQAERASLQAFDGWLESKNPADNSEQASQSSHSLVETASGAAGSGSKIEANSQKSGSETGQNSNGQPDSKAAADSANSSTNTPGSSAAGSKDNPFLSDISSRHLELTAAMNAAQIAGQAAGSQAGSAVAGAALPGNANSAPSNSAATAGNGTANPLDAAALTKAMSTDLPASSPTSASLVNAAGLIQNGGKVEMRVDLMTDALGAVQLHAVMQDGRLGASIGVENRDAHTLLTSELPALQQSLMDKNVQIEHLSVLDSSFAAGSQTAGEGSYAGGQASEQQAPAIWRTWSGQDAPLPGPTSISSENLPMGDGRLSVRA